MLQAPPFVHRHFSLPVAGIAGLKSLGESPQCIQFPIAILADTGNEEGDGIGEAGSDGGDIGKPTLFHLPTCKVSINSFSLSTNSWGKVMSRRTLKCESSDTIYVAPAAKAQSTNLLSSGSASMRFQ